MKSRTDNTMAKRKRTKGNTTLKKTKDRVTRTPLETGGELRCSGRVGSSCPTSICPYISWSNASWFFLSFVPNRAQITSHNPKHICWICSHTSPYYWELLTCQLWNRPSCKAKNNRLLLSYQYSHYWQQSCPRMPSLFGRWCKRCRTDSGPS
jgi:hypothetical protein